MSRRRASTSRRGYTGASADTVENSVTQVLEQQLTGHRRPAVLLEHVDLDRARRASTSRSSQGTDPDVAQVQVQNKVQQAIPRLPPTVQQARHRRHEGADELPDDRRDLRRDRQGEPTATSPTTSAARWQIRSRASTASAASTCSAGVRDADLARSAEALRAQADAVGYRGAIARAERSGLRRQDRPAAGAAGPAAQRDGHRAIASSAPPERVQGDHRQVRRDRRDGPARRRRARRARQRVLRRRRPGSTATPRRAAPCCSRRTRTRSRSPTTSRQVVEGLEHDDAARLVGRRIRSTATKFIRISIEEVVKTLIEAIALVVFVMFVFLQSWRATLIPVIAVPVVMLGTFCVLRCSATRSTR